MTYAIVKLLTLLKQYPFMISVNKSLVGAPQTHPYLVKNGYDCSSHLRQKMLLPQRIKPCSQSDARSCGSLCNVVEEVCDRDYAKLQTSASSSGGSAGDRPEVYSLVHKVTVLPALRFGRHRTLRFVRSGHSVYVHNVTTCDPILR